VADNPQKSATAGKNAPAAPGIPGSASSPHPSDGIPLPLHGFDTLDELTGPTLVNEPAADVIARAAVLLISAAADRLGIAPDGEPDPDLDEARTLINAVAALAAAAHTDLGVHRQAVLDGVRTLQRAFRETASHPDIAGHGPGEKYLL
jgi:hypothetical protein